MREIDLTGYSFEEFINFLFDHEVPPERPKIDPWYFSTSIRFDPGLICAYYVRLFRDPEFLRQRFTREQLDQGFWAGQGAALECSASRLVNDADLPLDQKAVCIRSMGDLFAKLFLNEGLDTAVAMWWDSFCYDWHCGNKNRTRGGEDKKLQDVYFEILSYILSLDSDICQGAALHGLGHLHHPDTPALIDRFIAQHPTIRESVKRYALAAAKFEVM